MKRDTSSTDWFIVLLTAVIALTSALQWKEIHSGSVDTHILAEAAKKQAEKAETISDATRQAAAAMDASNSQAKKSLDKTLEQSKAILDATIRTSRLDQRAWVVWKGIEGKPELDKPWNLNVYITNTGKTPAREMHISCHLETAESEENLTFKEGPFERGTIMAPNQLSYCVLHPLTVSKVKQETLDLLTSGRATVFVYGTVVYDDIFGEKHWLTFCQSMHPEGDAWDACQKHNDTGDGSKPE